MIKMLSVELISQDGVTKTFSDLESEYVEA